MTVKLTEIIQKDKFFGDFWVAWEGKLKSSPCFVDVS